MSHDLACALGELARAASNLPRGTLIATGLGDLALAAVSFTIQFAIDEASGDPGQLRALEGELVAALGAAREPLTHVARGVCADDHDGGLTQPLGELAAQQGTPAEQRVAVDVLGREDLDRIGLLQLAVPQPAGLGEGSTPEVQARQLHEGRAHLSVADPLARLVREVGTDVEPDRACGVLGSHESMLSELRAHGKLRSNCCYLYFDVDRRQRTVEIQTSWLPGIAPVKEALAPLGFARQPRGDWRTTVSVDDFVGVSRRVARALELLLTETLQLIE